MGEDCNMNLECLLNLADISNNNNKFYKITLRDNSVECRYGRVGAKGSTSLKSFDSRDQAQKHFEKIFYTKTKCRWGQPFKHQPGYYMMMDTDVPETTIVENPSNDAANDLDTGVSSFINLIKDTTKINGVIEYYGIDSKKLPLGKISNNQILKAEEILKELSGCDLSMTRIESLSSLFWTLVPSSCGTSRLPILQDSVLENAIEFVNILRGVKSTISMIATPNKSIVDKFSVVLEPLDPSSDDFDKIRTYCALSSGPTHPYSVELISVLGVQEKLKVLDTRISKRKLLFHGSRNLNYISILCDGLRVPCQKQVINGAALGYGVYFADCITKSFNYCRVDHGEVGIVLLCEVELGDYPEVVKSPPHHQPNKNTTSRVALGKYSPSSADDTVDLCGQKVIVSALDKCGSANSTFLYNEYCVFSESQFVVRYILTLKKCL